ncbi:hypothetical protein B566_EDAN012203 [Ephemera danica]|nr:hypothetical protein B566_EDAN012203 [Ephemera danica]
MQQNNEGSAESADVEQNLGENVEDSWSIQDLQDGTFEAKLSVPSMVMAKVKEVRATGKPITHFVCIPVTTQEVLQSFSKFKSEVLTYPDADETLLQTPMKLHLTLAVLQLLDEKEVRAASQLLEDFAKTEIRNITKGKPIEFSITGTGKFGKRSDARVLFGCVKEREDEKVIWRRKQRRSKSTYHTDELYVSTKNI